MLQRYCSVYEKVRYHLFTIYVVIGQFSFKWPGSSSCTVSIVCNAYETQTMIVTINKSS